jgi:hypothetical protein
LRGFSFFCRCWCFSEATPTTERLERLSSFQPFFISFAFVGVLVKRHQNQKGWKDLVSFNLFFIHDDNYTKGFRIYKMLVFICRKLILTILITKIK